MISEGLKIPNDLLLVGCGRMGGALLRGWLASGLSPDAVTVIDPFPPDWLIDLKSQGVILNRLPVKSPTVVVVATKPQVMQETLTDLRLFAGSNTVFVSIAAGTSIPEIEKSLERDTPIIRAMPNTPAAVGAGMSALVANSHVSSSQLGLARAMMNAVGQSIVLSSEEQMHVVTALSGSGPAFVFALAEAFAAAGAAHGLPYPTAEKLAIGTIAGAGQLMSETGVTPAELRQQVTSPEGTTAAGLGVLLREKDGLLNLASETIAAAAKRSRELSQTN